MDRIAASCTPAQTTAPPPVDGTGSEDSGFAEAVRPHLERLVSAARGLLGDDGLASDAVQETLVSLWRQKELPENLRSWLRRALLNRSLHLLRTCSRRRLREQRASHGRPESSERDNPVRILENQELRAQLDKALAQLPHDYRAALLLREVEQLDYEAIAMALAVPVGTVRSRLNRARQALRERLEPALAAASKTPSAQCRSPRCGCVSGQRSIEN